MSKIIISSLDGKSVRKVRRTDSVNVADIIKAVGESSQNVTAAFIEQQRPLLNEIRLPRERDQPEENSKEQLSDEIEQRVKRMEEQPREKYRELENSERLARERELKNFERQLRERELQEFSLHEQLREKGQQEQNSQKQLRQIQQQSKEKDEQEENVQRHLREMEQQLREKDEQLENLQDCLRKIEHPLQNFDRGLAENSAISLAKNSQGSRQSKTRRDSHRDLDEILKSRRPKTCRDLGEISKSRWPKTRQDHVRSRRDLTEMQKESNFTARSRQSRRDVKNLAANSTRFEKPTNMARSRQSPHDGGNLDATSPRLRNSQTSW